MIHRPRLLNRHIAAPQARTQRSIFGKAAAERGKDLAVPNCLDVIFQNVSDAMLEAGQHVALRIDPKVAVDVPTATIEACAPRFEPVSEVVLSGLG